MTVFHSNLGSKLNMYRLAVIGAGQLGSRHLQGLIRLDVDCQLFVVDPSHKSLEIARSRVEEMGVSGAAQRVSYHTSLNELPDHIDYAVIATAADIRLAVLQGLLNGRSVRNLLLEKVLFQRVSDYQIASDLLRDAGAQAWVNCPRRAFPIYQSIRNFFEGKALRHFQVHGGNWGLGCNSIHFLDLLAFLTGEVPHSFSTIGLDRMPIASKRANFMEFTGSLRGQCGTASFEITSLPQSSMRLMVVLRSEERTCIIDETAGQRLFYDGASGQSWREDAFRNPLVSELSTVIARDVLVNRQSALTAFADSASYHVPLIHALGTHSAEALGTSPDFCPIT